MQTREAHVQYMHPCGNSSCFPRLRCVSWPRTMANTNGIDECLIPANLEPAYEYALAASKTRLSPRHLDRDSFLFRMTPCVVRRRQSASTRMLSGGIGRCLPGNNEGDRSHGPRQINAVLMLHVKLGGPNRIPGCAVAGMWTGIGTHVAAAGPMRSLQFINVEAAVKLGSGFRAGGRSPLGFPAPLHEDQQARQGPTTQIPAIPRSQRRHHHLHFNPPDRDSTSKLQTDAELAILDRRPNPLTFTTIRKAISKRSRTRLKLNRVNALSVAPLHRRLSALHRVTADADTRSKARSRNRRCGRGTTRLPS
jgi:hypothetical protein